MCVQEQIVCECETCIAGWKGDGLIVSQNDLQSPSLVYNKEKGKIARKAEAIRVIAIAVLPELES